MSNNLIPDPAQAELELKHIQLELAHGRTNHMRHFVDQYYCYKKGFVNRNGGAHWEGIMWNDIVSAKARAITDRKLVVKEHVVPLRVIRTELLEATDNGKISLQRISEILDRLTRFGTITKEENQKLRDAGLNQAMPKGFREPGHPNYEDVMSRYREAGIELDGSL